MKILHIQPCYLAEQFGFKLSDYILQGMFALVAQIHKHRYARGKSNQFFLNFFAFAFVFFFRVTQLFFLFCGQLASFFGSLLFRVFYRFRFIDDGFQVLIERAEFFNAA